VLLDWSVRESFHLLHYLARQTVKREQFEVIVVEYYDRQSPALTPFRDMVDSWVLLDMPRECYYHKHLMYNVGIVLARGEVVLFCDSDAMVGASFVESIIAAFGAHPRAVLHLDQFRNVRQDLYPFAYPTFDEVMGPGCLNNARGRPRGLVEASDPLHERNYGACMAARRDDLIAIGGADEHLDYLGHICGPYEMTFRLINRGVPEVWHPTEFLYHTWHPGQAGDGNYLGPHDGRHMSTTALDALVTERTLPFVENPAVALLRSGAGMDGTVLEQHLIAADRVPTWRCHRDRSLSDRLAAETRSHFDYRGFRVERKGRSFVARLIVDDPQSASRRQERLIDATPEGIRRRIDRSVPLVVRLMNHVGSAWILAWRAAADARRMLSVSRAAPRATAAPSIGGWRQTFIRRVTRAWREFQQISGSLGSMLVNLHALRGADAGPIVLLLPHGILRACLRVPSALGLLPPVKFASPRNAKQLEAEMGELSRRAPELRIMVARELYLRYRFDFFDEERDVAIDVL
jgi:hypothetical protein